MSKMQVVQPKPKTERVFKLNTQAKEVVEYTKSLPCFTGVSRSVQCFENHGHRNFRIATFYIENDVIMRTEYSDPYAIWEAISRLELADTNACLHLNDRWVDGATLSK